MSKDCFTIISTSAFERAARKLAGKVPHMDEWLSEAGLILKSDPFNLSKQHQIKKLHGVDAGDGQWRLRLGVYRLRYDVHEKTVILRAIAHRRDIY